MTKLEAFQYALEFFVKRNNSLHDFSQQFVFTFEDIAEFADQLLEWAEEESNGLNHAA